MAEYAVTDSRSDEYRARAQDFFNRWGLDRSRPEKWSGSRDHFSEADKDLFLRGDHLPSSMQNDEGFYMGRQTRDLSNMHEDEYYTGAQKNEVNQAMAQLGMDANDSELKSGRILSHMFQTHMNGLTEPAPIEDSAHIAEAKERVQGWEEKSWSGDRAEETFGQGTEKNEYEFTDDPGPGTKEFDFTNDEYLNSHPSPSPVSQFSSANQ